MSKFSGLCRIGNDVEVRFIPSGEAVANLSLAFNFRDGKEKGTQWVEGALWGKRAQSLAPYLTKGTQIVAYLDDVHITTYEGKNGTGTKLVGRISDVELVAGKPESSERQERAPAKPQSNTGTKFDEMEDSTIPF